MICELSRLWLDEDKIPELPFWMECSCHAILPVYLPQVPFHLTGQTSTDDGWRPLE